MKTKNCSTGPKANTEFTISQLGWFLPMWSIAALAGLFLSPLFVIIMPFVAIIAISPYRSGNMSGARCALIGASGLALVVLLISAVRALI